MSAEKNNKPKSQASSDRLEERGEKLQKVLARTGMASRREIERWIDEGRITVDGKTAKLGDRIALTQRIKVDEKLISLGSADAVRCLLYHKPVGEVCSRKDPEGRPTVFESLPKLKTGRWIVIGRLDYNTSGLLLFTTDGELANRLMHPSSQIEREYLVRVMGEIDDTVLARLCEGVDLDDGPARFTDIQAGGGDGINRFFYVVLMEGRNREVRRLWESQGLTVSRLKRVRFGSVFIPSKLKKGQWMELPQKDIDVLYKMAELDPKSAENLTEKQREKQKRLAKRSAKRASRPGASERPGRRKK